MSRKVPFALKKGERQALINVEHASLALLQRYVNQEALRVLPPLYPCCLGSERAGWPRYPFRELARELSGVSRRDVVKTGYSYLAQLEVSGTKPWADLRDPARRDAFLFRDVAAALVSSVHDAQSQRNTGFPERPRRRSPKRCERCAWLRGAFQGLAAVQGMIQRRPILEARKSTGHARARGQAVETFVGEALDALPAAHSLRDFIDHITTVAEAKDVGKNEKSSWTGKIWVPSVEWTSVQHLVRKRRELRKSR